MSALGWTVARARSLIEQADDPSSELPGDLERLAHADDPAQTLHEELSPLLDDPAGAQLAEVVIRSWTGSPSVLLRSGDRFFADGDAWIASRFYARTVELEPTNVRAHRVLGNALRVVGEIDRAIAAYRRALDIRPDAHLHSRLLLALQSSSESPDTIAEEHRRWGQLHVPPPPTRSFPSRRQGPLRVGYVSPDLRSHPVAYFIQPIFENHDRDRVHVTAYSAHPTSDGVTRRMRESVDRWRDVSGMPAEQLADTIIDDGIDVAVDLAGHTSGNRLDALAHRAAPVQVTYLGYADTSGLEAVDYRITDDFADPWGLTDGWHVERLIRLIPGFLTFQPPSDAPDVTPTPALASGHITFGSFNKCAKITDSTVALWARVLTAVPRSRMLLKTGGLPRAADKERLQSRFAAHGLEADRVEILDLVPSRRGHLELYGRMDIALDTMPYNGTTTTCQALWMGVPLVSLPGSRHVSRVSGSLLKQIGLSELIANDAEHFVQIASELATDVPRLQEMRSRVRPMMASSPLLDHRGFCRQLEKAFESMRAAV